MNHQLKNDTENIKDGGSFTNPLGVAKNAFISAVDIGAFAAQCILEGPEKHGGKNYSVTGPVSMTMHDVAALLTKMLGKTVEYVPQDMEQFESDFGNLRADFIGFLNGYEHAPPDFETVMGRPPMTYESYLTTTHCDGRSGLEELFSDAGSLKVHAQEARKKSVSERRG
jgi:hypothetical protein